MKIVNKLDFPEWKPSTKNDETMRTIEWKIAPRRCNILFLDFDGVVCLNLKRQYSEEIDRNYPVFEEDLVDKLKNIMEAHNIDYLVASSNWCYHTRKGKEENGSGVDFFRYLLKKNTIEGIFATMGVTNNHDTTKGNYTRANEIIEFILNHNIDSKSNMLLIDDVVDEPMKRLLDSYPNLKIVETSRNEGLNNIIKVYQND